MAIYIIDGRLTNDAEQKTAGNGTSLVRFSVAWNRPDKSVHYYDCVIFGERGQKLLPYLKRGKYVLVNGEPSWREYNGKTYETINVDKLTFIGNKEDAQPSSQNPSGNTYPTQFNGKQINSEEEYENELWESTDPNKKGPETFDDGDIPF